jgi:hypothetical protein
MADQARSLNETMAKYEVNDGGVARASARAITAGNGPKMERRTATRPWAGKTASAAKTVARSASATAPADANGTDDAVWKEF